MTDTIVIKAPAGTKTRWVRQSQARGQKLSDWVVAAVDKGATAKAPCERCGSLFLTPDGPGWQCAGCGLVR